MNKVQLDGKLKGFQLRNQQIEAIDWIRESQNRFLFLNAPTGSGKSIIGLQAWNDEPIYYLCSSKILQDQLKNDFDNVAILKGTGNYQCKEFGKKCNQCVWIARKKSRQCSDCRYMQALKKAQKSKITILNYHVFLYLMNFTRNLKIRNVIVDEADSLESTIIDFLSFDISYDEFMKYRINPVAHVTKMEEFWEWEESAIKTFKKHLEHLDDEKEYEKLELIVKKLSNIEDHRDYEHWFFRNDREKQTMLIRPLWLTKELAEEIFYKFGKKFLFMSGTLPVSAVITKLLGVETDFDYFDVKSDFPIDSRKIYIVGKIDMSHKNMNDNLEILIDEIRKIIQEESHRAIRGLILVSSYRLLGLLKNVSERIVDDFETFKRSKNGILISAADWRGLDLKDDLCRFIIIPKIPFANLGDKMIATKMHSQGGWGQMWYTSEAITRMVQGYGRGMRHKGDFCETYIIDKAISTLIQKQIKLIPNYFLEACVF